MPPAPVRVPSQKLLARGCRVSQSVANDKSDNEMILGTVQSSPGICLIAEENPRKPQLGDRIMKRLCDQPASNGVSFLHMRLVGSHSTSGREKEGIKHCDLAFTLLI